ncbi:MAG: hypothetical protein WKF77_26445 [Planctomycetaceae bacterium]
MTTTLTIIESCDHCSACCRRTPIPPFQPGEEAAWNVPRTDPCRNELWLISSLNFSRASGRTATDRCLHYEFRPQACRDFQINSDLAACHAGMKKGVTISEFKSVNGVLAGRFRSVHQHGPV